MRLSLQQQQAIKQITSAVTQSDAKVILFGSRVDDQLRGGDVDLLIELPSKVTNSAWMAAMLAAKISRSMAGRHVDILLSAPNLETLTIHKQAKLTGIAL